VLNVHAGFPDATVKAVSNSLSSLWNGNYLTRVKGVTKNVSGQTLYDYTAKTIAPKRAKRAKPVLLWKDIIAVTPEEDEAMSKIANATQVGGTHYKDKKLQPWDAIAAWDCGFLDGNVIKYVVRYRSKGGVEDLKKARHYLDKLIELEELK